MPPETPNCLWAKTPRCAWERWREADLEVGGSTASFGSSAPTSLVRTCTSLASTCLHGRFVLMTCLVGLMFVLLVFRWRLGSWSCCAQSVARTSSTRSTRCRGHPKRWAAGWCFYLVLFSEICGVGAPRALATPVALRTRERLDAARLTSATRLARHDLYETFVLWMASAVKGCDVLSMVRTSPCILCEWVEEFVVQCYLAGWSRTKAAEMVLSIQDTHGTLRNNLGGAWKILRSWTLSEPGQLHPPVPWPLFQAMVVTALAWNWEDVATVLLLAFYALLRPIEYLKVCTSDIVLPESHGGGAVVFVGIPVHKTMRRGPRRTHVRIDDPLIVSYLAARTRKLGPLVPFFSGSAHTWRRRFGTLVEALTGKRQTILPSSLRPGAATYFFEAWGENLPRLQWRGRWASAKMLEHYVQELVAHQVLRPVSQDRQQKIVEVSALFARILEEAP